MGKLDNTRRIIKEDYDQKDHDLIGKLGYVLNSFMEQAVTQLNGNIDIANLKADIITVSMKVDASGIPIGNNLIKSDITHVTGTTVIRALNKTSDTTYPTDQPFISWTGGVNSSVIKVKKISGLQANHVYDLTIKVE